MVPPCGVHAAKPASWPSSPDLVPGAILGALLLAAPASDLVWAITSPLPGPAAISESAFIVLLAAVMAATVLGLWALARGSMRCSLRLADLARDVGGGNATPGPASQTSQQGQAGFDLAPK